MGANESLWCIDKFSVRVAAYAAESELQLGAYRSGYARASLLALRKNLHRSDFPPNCVVTA